MRATRTEYLFSVNTRTPPTISVDSSEEFTVEVRGAFDDIEDISGSEQSAGGSRVRRLFVVALFWVKA